MTPRPDPADELLSACHDGELSPSDRAAVEQLLEASPAAREALDDFRELSALLQSLERPPAPAQLHALVARGISARTARPTQASRGPRSWWLWGAPLALTAATLVLMVRHRPGDGEQLAHGAASSATEFATGAVTESSGAPAIADDALREVPRGGSWPDASGAETASPPTASSPERPQFEGLAASAAGQLSLDHAHPPEVSEVLAHVSRVGDQTVIVEMEVVNIDRAADDMLVLLRNRGVRILTDAAAADQPAVAAAQQPLEPGGPPLVAVYVEATEEQLARVMDDMMSQVAITEGSALNVDGVGTVLEAPLLRFSEEYAAEDPRDPSATPAVSGRRPPDAAARQRMVIPPPPAPVGDAGLPLPTSPPQPAPLRDAAEEPAAAGEWGMRLPLTREAYRHLEVRGRPAVPSRQSGSRPATEEDARQMKSATTTPVDEAGGFTPAVPRRGMLFVLQPSQPQ